MFVGTKTFSISRFLFFFPFVFVNDSTLFMPYDNRFFCERSLPSSLSFLLTLSPPALSFTSRPSIFLSPLSHFLLLLLSHFCSSSVFSSSIFFFFYFFLPLLTSSLLYPTFFLPFRFLSFSHFFVIFDWNSFFPFPLLPSPLFLFLFLLLPYVVFVNFIFHLKFPLVHFFFLNFI